MHCLMAIVSLCCAILALTEERTFVCLSNTGAFLWNGITGVANFLIYADYKKEKINTEINC